MRDKKFAARQVALCAMFLALALIASLLENLLPPLVPALPYAKIGLGNVVLLACFLLVGVAQGYVVLLLRCLLMAVFSGNFSALLWSLPSAFVAYSAMVICARTKIFSICGLSVLGGVLHNVVQICVAAIIVSKAVFFYLPYMIVAGGVAGIVTGVVCHFCVSALKFRFEKKPDHEPYVLQKNDIEDDDSLD